jgi:hypothetical protein
MSKLVASILGAGLLLPSAAAHAECHATASTACTLSDTLVNTSEADAWSVDLPDGMIATFTVTNTRPYPTLFPQARLLDAAGDVKVGWQCTGANQTMCQFSYTPQAAGRYLLQVKGHGVAVQPGDPIVVGVTVQPSLPPPPERR